MVKDASKLLIPERNIVTVETFRNGKLRQRARTHNMITQPGLDWLKYKRDYGLNTGIAAGKNTHKVPLDCFNTIMALSDATAPVIGETCSLADVIAWANKTAYTGADTRRGTVNLVESYCTDDLIHWAIDFPTHAGNNGVINSIGWLYGLSQTTYIQGGYKNNLVGNILTLSGLALTVDGISLNTSAFHCDGTYIWICYQNNLDNSFRIYKLSLTGDLIASYTSLDSLSVFHNINSIAVDGNILYVLTYKGAPGTTSTLHVYNLTTETKINSYTLSRYATEMCFADGTLFTRIIGSDIVYKYSTAGIEIGPTTILWDNTPSFSFFNSQYFDEDKIIAFGQSTTVIYNYVTGEIKCLLDSENTNGYRHCMDKNFNFYSFQYATGNLYKQDHNSLGARALLPVPIQKTAADTMRITYDFDIRY